MTEIVTKFLISRRFVPGMNLRQPWFTYSACGPFTKSKERIEKFKTTLNLRQPWFTYSACGPFTKSKERIEKFKTTLNLR